MPSPRPLILSTLLLTALLPACRPHQHPTTAPTTRLAATHPAPRPKPMLDLSHGFGSFPLSAPDTDPLTTTPSLSAALHTAYLARLTPAPATRPAVAANNVDDPTDFVTLRGTPPALKLLRIDVSGAHVRPDYRPAKFSKSSHTERTLTVHDLKYLADPLHYDRATAGVRVTATDAQLHLTRDQSGTRGLVLAGARHGQLFFHAATADFNRMLSIAPGRAGGRASNLTILRSTVSFTSPDPHTITGTLDLRARWLLLPLTLSLRGTLTADPATGTATFSNLAATGYDPGGLLAAAALNPSLHKLNGHSQPLVTFPDPQTHITDIHFSTTPSTLSLTIDFGQ